VEQIPDTLGHGKESIAVNLKKKEAIEIIKQLSVKSDVLIEPFRKGIKLENDIEFYMVLK
jgi:crotonobetainyl-CoA:carnitine CoA-transferase CaiB-like acyl-CoA transferase